jgi:hypothetical protein
VVGAPPPPSPCGASLASQFASDQVERATLGEGNVTAKGKVAQVPIDSAPGANPCQVRVELLGVKKPKKGKGHSAKKRKKRSSIIGGANATIPGGQTQIVKVKLTKRGRLAARRGRVQVRVTTIDKGGNTVQTTLVKVAHKKKGKHKHHR